MAQTIKLKRSSVAGNVPGSSDLALGEIAVNTADGAVYIKKDNNDIVAVADNDILHIDTAGKVGIGTTSPGKTLDVNGSMKAFAFQASGSGNKVITIGSSNDGTYYNGLIVWNQYNTSQPAHRLTASSSGGSHYEYGRGMLSFIENQGSNVTRMVIKQGNVGINETTPLAKLEVAGSIKATSKDTGHTSEAGVTLSYDTSNSIGLLETWTSKPLLTRTYNYQAFDISGTEMMRINSTGIGIGTTSPDTKLDITTSGVEGLIINQDTTTAATSSRLFFKDSTRINGMLNVNGILEFRTDMVVGSTSGTKRFSISPTLVKTEVPLRVEEYQIDTTETSTTATTQVAIHTFAAATFRSARFTVQVTNSTDSTYHTSELLLVHDGTTANITEFGEIHTGSAVEATFDADISSGNVRLLATPASTDTMAFKVVCHSITT